VLAIAALVTRSGPVRALVIGAATHFVLDFVGLSMNLGTLLWPLLGWHFPTYPFRSFGQHLGTIFNPITFLGETLGAAILWRDYRNRRKAEHQPVPGGAP
jgi:hypothetical protein